MSRAGIVRHKPHPGYQSKVVSDGDFTNVKFETAGVFYKIRGAMDHVTKGETLAKILDPYDGSVRLSVTAPENGWIFFAHDKPMVVQNTLLYKIV